ncbi:ferric reductase-like transmembrane domain-containing protein [uncultured Friedmanniella sp.]|uniref:ferredoxin reductase family protein n=1 Tax=uncultured Friedmanniella sp. TaxID=335381 RepID=UPI0035CAF666
MTTPLTSRAVGAALPLPAVDDRRARLDAAVRLAGLLGLWGSLLLVTYWWDVDGGIGDLAGWASGLMSVGRLSGLLASVLMLVQVLMMARLPFLEHAFGADRLAQLHRIVGFTSFDLLLLHLVTIIWGYAEGRLSATPATAWHLVKDYGGVLLSVAGFVCLVMVVFTSIRAARRKLRYESWHLIHLYGYLGAGLALPHQLWAGQEFLLSPARTVFWWTLWIATAVAVVVWRVGLPVLRTLRHRLRVTAVVPEGDGVVSVWLGGRSLDRLPVEAGQFVHLRFLAGTGWSRGNPYSLSAAPDGHSLRITAKAVGDGSARLVALAPGTRVVVEGPYGRLSPRARSRRRVALIGAGVGITPLRALAEGLEYAPGEAVLLHRYAGQPLFADEFSRLAADRGLQVVPLPGRRRDPGSWLGDRVPAEVSDAAALRFWVPDLADRDVFVCGPDAWAMTVQRLAEEAGTPRDHIHVESFGSGATAPSPVGVVAR